jgi:hypothetical protein
MGNSWTYPISGDMVKFEDEGSAEFDTAMHYFTRAKQGYSPSGLLRSMALFIDGLPDTASVEAMMSYPELGAWSGLVAVYHDRPAA